jgi:hypothetical protein
MQELSRKLHVSKKIPEKFEDISVNYYYYYISIILSPTPCRLNNILRYDFFEESTN